MDFNSLRNALEKKLIYSIFNLPLNYNRFPCRNSLNDFTVRKRFKKKKKDSKKIHLTTLFIKTDIKSDLNGP